MIEIKLKHARIMEALERQRDSGKKRPVENEIYSGLEKQKESIENQAVEDKTDNVFKVQRTPAGKQQVENKTKEVENSSRTISRVTLLVKSPISNKMKTPIDRDAVKTIKDKHKSAEWTLAVNALLRREALAPQPDSPSRKHRPMPWMSPPDSLLDRKLALGVLGVFVVWYRNRDNFQERMSRLVSPPVAQFQDRYKAWAVRDMTKLRKCLDDCQWGGHGDVKALQWPSEFLLVRALRNLLLMLRGGSGRLWDAKAAKLFLKKIVESDIKDPCDWESLIDIVDEICSAERQKMEEVEAKNYDDKYGKLGQKSDAEPRVKAFKETSVDQEKKEETQKSLKRKRVLDEIVPEQGDNSVHAQESLENNERACKKVKFDDAREDHTQQPLKRKRSVNETLSEQGDHSLQAQNPLENNERARKKVRFDEVREDHIQHLTNRKGSLDSTSPVEVRHPQVQIKRNVEESLREEALPAAKRPRAGLAQLAGAYLVAMGLGVPLVRNLVHALSG